MRSTGDPDEKTSFSGDVCLVHITVSSPNDPGDQGPWDSIAKREYRLREEFSLIIRRTLGPEFEMRAMTLGRGSVELLVVVGTAYYAVSRYKNFIESLDLMVDQMRSLVGDLFARQPGTGATATWTPLPPLLAAEPGRGGPTSSAAPSTLNRLDLLTLYLLFTHGAMLVVLIWLVFR